MKVLFFAQAADAAGTREHPCPLASADTDTLWAHLLAAFPPLSPLRASIRLTRNGHYATGGETFHRGDEVALIPPVSGG